MSDERWIDRGFESPHVALYCECGWAGTDAEIVDWDVQFDRDRVVRTCPKCGRTVPEWGALGSIEGAARIARGPLERSLVDAGVLEE